MRVSPLKVIASALSLVVIIYLLLAERLFGLGGGGRAEMNGTTAARALERTLPAAGGPRHATGPPG
jgi:hypothetical protein